MITQGLHRPGRDFVRRSLGELMFIGLTASHEKTAARLQVRQTLSWPRSWANFSLLELYPHGNAWATSHLLGQVRPA